MTDYRTRPGTPGRVPERGQQEPDRSRRRDPDLGQRRPGDHAGPAGVSLPFAEKLPRPEEFVATGYDFAEQLLASQRKFAEDVLQVTAAAMPAHETPAKKATSAAK